ncbi:polyhomeotic-like protein 2 isoform X2 [Parasteatoda tepidariorum]|uniref:polyhomeotic-like protein 2 isoform X2 n=1 Tax=Parasteatoda tepidariorum TaxID=114398 RepID=UPI00077F9F68|nr:polyhomeotic-like protein 2 isoform X2 [Parasteatoda tepidariorum]
MALSQGNNNTGMSQLNTNNVQMAVSQMNTNSGTPVQTSVSQLTAQVQAVQNSNMMSQNPQIMAASDVPEVQMADLNTSTGQSMQMTVPQLNSLNSQMISNSDVSDVQITQLNSNTGQPVQISVSQLNTSTGAPIQTSVPQLTAQAQTVPAGTMISQSSGPHSIMIHPMMTMTQAPLQQLQGSGTPVQMTVPQRNATGGGPVQMTQLNTSTGQQVQMAVSQLNTSAGTQVQTSVPQLTAQAQTMPMMSQSSAPHPTMIHPTMAQSPLQQVQVIQPQQLPASYLQHLYPQQQMLFPGNLTLQHAGMTAQSLQGLGATQGLSLQLQAKAIDPKQQGSAQNLQAVNTNKQSIAVNAGTMMTAPGQMFTAPKANFQQQMMTAQGGKSTIIHSQSGFAPANANQTVVIGQLGMLPNQQTILNQKALQDSQKGKAYAFQSQPTALQPKSLYSSSLPVNSTAQVFNSAQLKQISSQPQIITSQAPGNVLNQAQLFGLQTIGASLPPGLSWATPGCLQSSALLGQNPIIIRSQESNMYIQQQPQTAMHLPVAAAAAQPMPPTSFVSTANIPQKQKQVKVRPGTQTVAVATQTIVSSAPTVHSNTPPIRAQIKPKAPKPIATACSPQIAPQMATTQTQTNQPPQIAPQHMQQPSIHILTQQKSDASNQTQTNQTNDRKPIATYSRSVCVGVDAKQQLPPPPLPKSQAMVAPSAKIIQATVSPCNDMSVSTSTSTITTVSSSMPILPTSTVQINTSVPTFDVISTITPSVSHVSPLPKVVVVSDPVREPNKSVSTEPMQEAITSHKNETAEASVEKEPLKPQQPIAKPALGPVKEKQPQKAIVKPQVLTHVIDGFVIQEGPEPFPVRPSVLDSPCRNVSDKLELNQKRKEIQSSVASPEKKVKIHRGRGPGRKRKVGRGRKSLKKQALIEESEEVIESPVDESNTSITEDDSSVLSNKAEEEHPMHQENSSLPPATAEQEIIEIQKADNSDFVPPSQKLPSSWSVQDVFEFIKDTPGCSDYADTFRSQEIDGQALLLLKEDHLMTMMCMKLGPAVKLISVINGIKEELEKKNFIT